MSNCNQGELAIRCVTNCLHKIDNDATVFNRPTAVVRVPKKSTQKLPFAKSRYAGG